MNEELVVKYFEILYPEFDSMEPREKYIAVNDQIFIREHLDEIDKYYQSCQVPGTYAYNNKMSDREILEGAVKKEKAKKYFSILHPEYDSLHGAEKFKVLDDHLFILDNIDAIDEYYQNCQIPGTYAHDHQMSDREILEGAVKKEKAKKYFRDLHPEFDNLHGAEKFSVMDDDLFILDHIDAIDAHYRRIDEENEELSAKEKIEQAVNMVRNEKSKITPDDIEQATQGVRIEGFKQATEDIKQSSKEEQEKTEKEGVSLDD